MEYSEKEESEPGYESDFEEADAGEEHKKLAAKAEENKYQPNKFVDKFDHSDEDFEYKLDNNDEVYEDSFNEYQSDYEKKQEKIAKNENPEKNDKQEAVVAGKNSPPIEKARSKPDISKPPQIKQIKTQDSLIKKSVQTFQGIRKQSPKHETSPEKSKNEKKSKQLLEKENFKLRSDLKALNEQLSIVLEAATAKIKKKSKKDKTDSAISSNQVTDKRLKIYLSEYNIIKERFDMINDTEYLDTLKKGIKNKEKKANELEKILKNLQKDQHNRAKKIENFDDKELADKRILFSQLQEEFSVIDDQIRDFQAKIEKSHENYEKNYEKEVELEEKLEKLKTLSEHYAADLPTPDKKQVEKHSAALNSLNNIEKMHTGALSQLKVQENSLKVQKDQIWKEIKLNEDLLKRRTEDLAKTRTELEEVMLIATSKNMGKLVSILNSSKRPSSDYKSSSPRSDTERANRQFSDVSRKNNRDNPGLPRNQSSQHITKSNKNEENRESNILGNSKNAEKNSENSQKKENFDKKFTPFDEKPKKHPLASGFDEVRDSAVQKRSIFEELESQVKQEENNKKVPSIFKELESENKPNVKASNVETYNVKGEKHSSLFKELQADDKPVKEVKSSLFQELAKEAKTSVFKELEQDKKHSFFKELESDNKPTLFKELESNSKPSLFKELESNNKPSLFKELESDNKPSLFKELESDYKPSLFKESKLTIQEKDEKKRSSLFDELEKDSKNDNFFNKNNDFGSKESKNSEFQEKFKNLNLENVTKNNTFNTKEEKFGSLFNQIDVSDPKTKRNRDYLTKKPENKEEKLLNLAENAGKNDLFSNLFDNNDFKAPVSIQTKLLPTKISGIFENKPEVKSEPKPEPKKPNNFELEEEDLIL